MLRLKKSFFALVLRLKNDCFLFFFSLFFSLLITFRTWGFELFSDDWIWILFSKKFELLNFLDVFQLRFAGFWRPTMTLWFWITRFLDNFNPIAQHILSALLLGIIAYLAANLVSKNFSSRWPGVVVIIFIILNSAGSEAWLWYSAIGDLLLVLFILLCLISVERYGNKLMFCVFVISYIMALLAKETAAIFPLLILFYPPVFILLKRKEVKFLFFYIFISVLYFIAQFQIGLNRNEPLSYSIDRIIILFNSWFESVIPKLGQLIMKDNIFRYFGLILGSAFLFFCFYLYKKHKDERRIIVWFVLASFFILLPTTILSVPAGRLLASRYLFSSSVFWAISIGLIFGRIRQRKLKYLFAGFFLVWSVHSFLALSIKINNEYLPIDKFMKPLKVSLGQEIDHVGNNDQLYVGCSFPFDHNAGYLKAIAEVVYNFSEERVIFLKETSSVELGQVNNLIAWDYNINKFRRINFKDFPTVCSDFLKK